MEHLEEIVNMSFESQPFVIRRKASIVSWFLRNITLSFSMQNKYVELDVLVSIMEGSIKGSRNIAPCLGFHRVAARSYALHAAHGFNRPVRRCFRLFRGGSQVCDALVLDLLVYHLLHIMSISLGVERIVYGVFLFVICLSA